MSNLVVRGMAEDGTLPTAGYGPQSGTTFFQSLAGSITMVGSLLTTFIAGGGGDAEKNQGGIRIDIDLGI